MSEEAGERRTHEPLAALEPSIAETLGGQGETSRGCAVLLVSGRGVPCKLLQRALTARGHCPAIARTTNEAIDEFYRHAFELIIIDQYSEVSANDQLMRYMWLLIPRQRILSIDFLELCPSGSQDD
jgi:hypothetical protein